MMIKNYIKTALRIIIKNKIFSIINILGLAIGLTASILISFWIKDELSYDKFHEHSDNIYRVLTYFPDYDDYGPHGPGPLAGYLKENIPEITNAVTVFPVGGRPLRHDKDVLEVSLGGIDSTFFDIFTFPFKTGNPEEALSIPNFIIITEETALKYFDQDNPIGKIMHLDWWGRWLEFEVTGVIKNVPKNSSMQFDVLLPLSFVTNSGMRIDTWDVIAYHSYILLEDKVDAESIDEKIKNTLIEQIDGSTNTLKLQEMTSIHLIDPKGGGPIKYVYLFSSIAFAILLLAGINFINLTTSRMEHRFKEIGIRKTVGAKDHQLIWQITLESILMTLLALFFAIIFVELFRTYFNQLTNKNITLNYTDIRVLFIFIIFALALGTLTGIYPAIILARTKALQLIRKLKDKGVKKLKYTKLLIVLQFVISITLIICSLVIQKQIHYMLNKDLGYDKDLLMNIQIKGNLYEKYNTVKQKLLENPSIKSSTRTNFGIYSGYSSNGIWWEGKNGDDIVNMPIRSIDLDFQSVFGFEIAEGRFFGAENIENYLTLGVVLNESAVKKLGLESPVGKQFICPLPLGRQIEGQIIGVVKDFHFNSLRNKIEPLILAVDPWWYTDIFIRLTGNDVQGTIKYVEKTINELVPDCLFEYSFYDDDWDQVYQNDQRTRELVNYGTYIAVIIACLGLLGLAIISAEQRTKEIAIRKINGAGTSSLIYLFNKSFISIIIIAAIIASPISYILLDRWLNNFAYKISISIWFFAEAGIIALLIALFSVSTQTIKVARKNPVESLRYE